MLPALQPSFPDVVSDERRDELIDSFARLVVRRRLETAAVFLLEAHRPVGFLASQTVLFSAPLLGAFFGFQRLNEWARVLEQRENWDRLISRIESLARDRGTSSTEQTEKGSA